MAGTRLAGWLADALALAAVFVYELGLSSLIVARAAFARKPRVASAIVAVPIELRTDLGIATLANLVTLTPGTCSLHVSEDRRTLYVHALNTESPEQTVAGIKRAFERRIARLER
jgi:multicomponent Na+:H+ antiporter subunit E